ncbi:MAG TPA: diacylglycerol kinase family protein [Anaerolineae bacterium]
MRIKVILNPYANRWRARARLEGIKKAFAAVHVSPDIVITEKERQGTGLARAAVADGYDVIVAAGGDGTVGEVTNGLIKAAGSGPTVPFGILPIGTANDFSDLVGLPRDLDASVRVIVAGNARLIDAGQINMNGEIHYFVNNSALAMEPLVTLENVRMTRLSGETRYIVALIRGLIKLQAWQMRINWDGGGYEGPAYLLSICNGPRTGGFYMAPDAKMNDGLFDFVFAPKVPKWTVLIVLFRLLRKTHIYHAKITYGRSAHLAITSQPGTPIHADGEVLSESVTTVAYDILPDKVTLLSP